jgi:Fe2+ transport system protein FeoA
MTLADAPIRVPLTVIDSLTDPTLRSRMSTLGLRGGARCQVVRQTLGGARVVAVEGSRIAMDTSLLRLLTVRPDDGSPHLNAVCPTAAGLATNQGMTR